MELVEEQFAFSGGTVDESGPYPIIRGVHLCGLESKHGYSYLPTAWTDAAIQQYDGADSYEGHKAGPRLPSEKVGVFHSPRRRQDGTPEADYHLEPDHPMTPRLIRAAKHDQSRYALSHRAHVQWGTRGGKRVVEGFGGVLTVDVVGSGGTTGGIFESAPTGGRTVSTAKEYANKLAPKLDVGQLLKLKTLVQEDDFGAAPMPADAPAPDAADTTADGGIDSAFQAVALKEIADCMAAKGDPAKLKRCLGRLKKLLMTHGELSSDDVDGAEVEGEGGEGEGTTEEGAPAGKGKKTATAAAPTGPTEGELIQECFTEKLTPTPNQFTALKGMPDKATRTAFIREQKGFVSATAPKSQGRTGTVAEDGTGAGGNSKSGVEQAAERARQHARENQGLPPAAK